MTFSTKETREKMLEHDANLAKIVGGITFNGDNPIVSILELSRGSWKNASFSDSNVPGNSCQGSFPAFVDGKPTMFGAEGSGGASNEFEEITEDRNLLGWKAFNQLQPNKKSWIVSSLLAFQGYTRDEVSEAMKANSPLPDTDIEAIVEFIFQVSEAYTALLEHVSFIDSAVWEVKSKGKKASKSVSSKEKAEAFSESMSKLGLL
jgi:hypothetical protein